MRVFSTMMFPIGCIGTFIISFLYEKSKLISKFNEVINYRLGFNYKGFMMYGLSLFGKKIEMVEEYWDANNITGMSCTFLNCQNIRNIDLSKWNIKNVANMQQTFWNMKKLKNLYLNNTEFNLDILKKYDKIITGCQEEINVYVKDLNSAEFISDRLKENNITAQIYYGNDNTLYSE